MRKPKPNGRYSTSSSKSTPLITIPKKPYLLTALLLTTTTFLLTTTSSLAVDHSKFRTCAQTSFCRRNRHGRSSPEYEYRILPESIRFHRTSSVTPPPPPPQQTKDRDGGAVAADAADADTTTTGGNGNSSPKQGTVVGEEEEGGTVPHHPLLHEDEHYHLEEEEKEETQKQKGILASIGRMLYKSDSSSSSSSEDSPSSDKPDPYVRGPKPFFTATLTNVSPHRYPNTNNQLNLAIYLLNDGVARARITETYVSEADGTNGRKPYEKARWTSDELILNWKEMGVDYTRGGGGVEVIGWPEEENDETKLKKKTKKEDDQTLIKRLAGHLDGDVNEIVDGSVLFRYGGLDGTPQSLFLVRIAPFELHMWREGDDDGPPIVSVNADRLMHFEIRREKEEEGPNGGDGHKGNSDVVRDDEEEFDDDGMDMDDFQKDNEEDVHNGKEITGYWEDGLAIYADGTRQQPSDKQKLHADTATSETERRLQEKTNDATDQTNTYTPDTKDLWAEKFSSHHDSKPYGPTSVGADVQFPRSSHIFGLPEHASSLRLRSTIGGEGSHYSEPYRLYNLDVFEYELDETMALYGEVPLIISQSAKSGTAGIFWFNPSETFVDVATDVETAKTHWISESGVLDLFLLPGPDPPALYRQYGRLTGRLSLPPVFALGYHQCRWNYRDEEDVYAVHAKFEELDYPYDVLWLDIEHTDGKRYFTWDKGAFPNPVKMQETLKAQGRNMVTIVDPHIKRDNGYYIHQEATAKGLYTKDKDGNKDYDGWCWPGSSSYLDFTNGKVRHWWAKQFAYDRYQGSTPSLYTWNDMNEPSVFNGPEVSMPKDLKNLDGVEHREWHNLYGALFQRATANGLVRRNEGGNERPFVLSRSFFAGSQKYGAIWTGDNEASWAHLKIAAPMLLSLNSAALSFVGADVGGFFGNPDAELMTRWMQAGAYTPFFRGHAHHDSKRREPWIFGHEWMVRMRRAAISRYSLLPFWYTLFREASVTGMPVMRPMWMQYPKIESLYGLDDQYLIGSDLLVKPVTEAGATHTDVMFPLSDTWYDVDTMIKVSLPDSQDDTSSGKQERSIDIDTIPVYQRGGSIIPRKLRLRRSTQMMVRDPYTLYVALDSQERASGDLYIDDGHSFDHETKKHYGIASFSVDWKGSIRNDVSIGSDDWERDIDGHLVERIVVMGVEKEPKSLTMKSTALDFQYDTETKVLIVRKPLVSALTNWKIQIVS